jgi:predicted methyltransferase
MEYRNTSFVLLGVTLLLTVACERPGPENAPVPLEHSGELTVSVGESVYAMAQNNSARSQQDRARDDFRKPAEVMQFFGIEAGMAVLDLFSGGGYYTELLSYVVGPGGKVVAHTNAAYDNYVGEETKSRYADGRLPNVEVQLVENNAWSFPDEAFDAVTMILAYHDIYYVAPDDGWPKIDGPELLAEIYQSMKPGAVLGIVDHVAASGTPRETGNSLHRIDPAIVRAELEEAGFLFEEESALLRNPDDDHLKNMADPEIRGRTDRFVMRFRKPD